MAFKDKDKDKTILHRRTKININIKIFCIKGHKLFCIEGQITFTESFSSHLILIPGLCLELRIGANPEKILKSRIGDSGLRVNANPEKIWPTFSRIS